MECGDDIKKKQQKKTKSLKGYNNSLEWTLSNVNKRYSGLKTRGRGAEVYAGSTLQRRQLMELNEGFVSIKGKG